MAERNIRLRKKNGNAWDTLYPESLAENIKTRDKSGNITSNVQTFIDTVYDTTATGTANGAMSKEDKKKLDGIEAGANRYVHPNNASTRHVSDTQISNWNDKYTRQEIDSLLDQLNAGLDWKESVNTYNDLLTRYPNAEDGWTVNVKDTDITYRYSGTKWIAISANAIPLVSDTTDGKMSSADKIAFDAMKIALDQALKDIDGIGGNMSSNISGIQGTLNGMSSTIGRLESSVGNLENNKANNDHRHDSDYSPINHLHDERYAPINHQHTGDFLNRSGDTMTGDLGIAKEEPTIIFKDAQRNAMAEIKHMNDGSMVISPYRGKSLSIRPNGVNSLTNETVINESGVYFNARQVCFEGHGVHVPQPQTANNAVYLRNDNTWQTITPAKIGASEEDHVHNFDDIMDKPRGAAGQVYYLASNNGSDVISDFIIKKGLFATSDGELATAKNSTTANGSVIYDLRNGSAWVYRSGWAQDADRSLMEDIGAGRILFDTITKKMFFVESTGNCFILNEEKPIYASNIITDSNHKFVSDAEKNVWNAKASTAIATQSSNGLMSSTDKKKLDSIDATRIGVKKYTTSIGNGSSTTFTLNHGLGTEDIAITVKEISTNMVVYPAISYNSTSITLTFSDAPTAGQYKVIAMG